MQASQAPSRDSGPKDELNSFIRQSKMTGFFENAIMYLMFYMYTTIVCGLENGKHRGLVWNICGWSISAAEIQRNNTLIPSLKNRQASPYIAML